MTSLIPVPSSLMTTSCILITSVPKQTGKATCITIPFSVLLQHVAYYLPPSPLDFAAYLVSCLPCSSSMFVLQPSSKTVRSCNLFRIPYLSQFSVCTLCHRQPIFRGGGGGVPPSSFPSASFIYGSAIDSANNHSTLARSLRYSSNFTILDLRSAYVTRFSMHINTR